MATSNSVRASSFTASAETRDLVYNTLLHNSMYLVQAIGLPLAFYLKPFCIICALFWLSYRASQVLNKDLTDLAQLLGFELPLKPVLDLTGIRADGAIVHWTLPEKQRHKSTLKYEVYVNGNVIDTVSVHESAVTITGLQPGSFYVVRVALVNSLEFSSKSAPIRFLTKPAASGDFYQVTADGHETDHDASRESLPTAKPYRGLKDVVPASPDMIAPPMLRENSTGLGHKKSITGRRPSPAVLGLDNKHDPAAEDCEPPEGAESIQQLTAKLDSIRHETEEAEKQMREEEEEESRQKEELIKERDELRLEVGKKEKANRDLKKEVNILERQNTAAQNERSKHERILQQKKQERQKMKEDNERWIRETEELKAETERIKQKKTELLAQHEKDKEVQRQKLAAVTADLKFLDEDTREKTVEIKKIERAAKNSSPNGVEPETNLVQQMQQDHEEDRAFQMRRFELQQQYAAAVQRLEGAKAFHAEQVRFLEGIRAGRRRAEEAAAAASAAREFPSPPATSERGLRRGDSERSRRGTSNESPRMSAFPPVSSSSPFGGNMAATAFSSAPFLNIHNGMTIAAPTAGLDISEEEKDKLTGGAPMSPGAGAELLPADLFSGDDSRDRENIGPLPGLGTLPGLAGAIPGLGAQPSQQVDFAVPGPASPGSTSSRSPSTFASPRASQNNLHAGSPENYMDSDRRSIQSTRSNRAPSGSATGSRFSSMFGIKPRVKNSSTDDSLAGPALAKAQSVPRQDQGVSGLDSATRKRNSSISGSVFGGVLSRGVQSDETEDLMDGSTAELPMQARRRPFNLFHRDKGPDGWPSSFTLGGRRPASPRPGSTHSSELPRPSFDSSRWGVDTWPSNDAASGARNSPLSFGSWNVPIGSQQPRVYGSRHPSRRPSVQHGASGPPEDIMEDEDDTDALDSDAEPNLPPIGTRPAGSKRADKQAEAGAAQSDADADAAQPKLNPNAKDFKSFFSLSNMRLSSSKDKSKDGGEASSSKTPTSATPAGGNTPLLNNHHPADDEISPPASRKSKDTRSMTTIESSASTDNLARTPSYSNASDTNSNASPLIGAGSFSGKESFMQKISRKSSSGKFSLPTFKREKSKLPEPATPTAEDVGEDEETAIMGGSTSSLKEKGGRTWSTVLKLGKGRERKVGDAPSVSGASAADEEEGDEEELLEK